MLVLKIPNSKYKERKSGLCAVRVGDDTRQG